MNEVLNNTLFTHTMIRVKDAEQSLHFYCDVLGMTLLYEMDDPVNGFNLYYLKFMDDPTAIPSDESTRRRWLYRQEGVLELTFNYGTDQDPDFTYQTGNSERQGYGHICISVRDFQAAIAWFDRHQVRFIKRPEDGRMKHIAFIADPDGYRIEVLQAENM